MSCPWTRTCIRPRTGQGFAVSGGVPKGLQKDGWVLLTAYLPISCHPSVVTEAVAKHATEDRANSESTLRARGHVSEHVPDAPQGTQGRRVPLLVIEPGEALSEIESLITDCV